MDEALLQAFRDTHYLVCIDAADWACIRVHQTLPDRLQQMVGLQAWACITAWNPRAKAADNEDNLADQRLLLAALKGLPDGVILPAIGIGTSGWHEPSLFVIGTDQTMLDTLGRRFQQLAYIHGKGNEPAQLRVLQY